YDADGNQLIRRDPGKTTLNIGADELTLDTASGSMSDVRYYSSPGGLTITRVTAATGGGQLVYQAADPHGTNSAQITTDASQTVTRRPTDPFGNPRGTQPDPATWAGDKGFVGGTKDDSTGLTNLGAREYQPTTGRFLNPDLLLDAASPQQWNGYAYSNNDPVNLSDPSGMHFEECSNGMYECEGGITPVEKGANYDNIVEENTRPHSSNVSSSATTRSNGAGSGGSGNGRGTKKCGGGWISGTLCHASNGLTRTRNFTTDHPIVRAIVVMTIETVATTLCLSGGAAGAVATGGASAVAAAAGCGAVAGAIGAGLNNLLDGNADHSLEGQAKAVAGGAIEGAASGALGGAIGEVAAEAGEGGAAVARTACRTNSFPAGTEVLLADGTTKPIDQLAVGDKVTATDPQTGTTTGEHVTQTITTPDDKDFTDLKLTTTGALSLPAVAGSATASTAVLTSTQHHPYWNTTTQRWTAAAELRAGDQLQTPDGDTATVESVRNYRTDPTTAYNLTVEQLHTYYVLAGATPVLVHNCDTEFAGNAMSGLPSKVTSGRIFDAGGNDISAGISSGSDGTTAAIDDFLKGSPSISNPRVGPHPAATHVETKYAWWMRQNGVTDADVVINNPKGVCPFPFGCQAAVPAILPRGSTMRVWYPGATEPKVLEGLG
ncbi:DddA-like double-stranded DNA deaminase toxin, partial [Saccharothrix sp. ST-888]|uniref:DddA-like double-stranded DNA deaminase toxin n=1 Tax=Saccharothrix sp. ST-888 TaxID=1427391 RepID=UPI000AFB41CE